MTDYLFLSIVLTVAAVLIALLSSALIIAPNPFIADYVFALKVFSSRENAVAIAKATESMYKILGGKLNWTIGDKHLFITTDPMEDLDDTMLLWALIVQYDLLVRTDANVYICLSGGLVTPADRFAYLKRIFPQLADLDFGVKRGSITFYADSVDFFVNIPSINLYLNCGPCSSGVKNFIANKMPGYAVFVGTEADGTASDGVNQRSTDIQGKLTVDRDNWNAFAALVCEFVVVSPEVSRYVLLPAFENLPDTKYAKIPEEYPQIEMTAWETVLMFTASRPSGAPPAICARINTANSIFVHQMFLEQLNISRLNKAFKRGINWAREYSKDNRHMFVECVLPFVATSVLGGEYANGFGAPPHLKSSAPYLTPESKLRMHANLRQHCQNYTPAYDLLALGAALAPTF